jgi:hypothetical protein
MNDQTIEMSAEMLPLNSEISDEALEAFGACVQASPTSAPYSWVCPAGVVSDEVLEAVGACVQASPNITLISDGCNFH